MTASCSVHQKPWCLFRFSRANTLRTSQLFDLPRSMSDACLRVMIYIYIYAFGCILVPLTVKSFRGLSPFLSHVCDCGQIQRIHTNSSGSFKLINENNRTHKDATVGQREWKVYNFNPLHTGLQKQIHRKRKDNQRNSASVLHCFVSTCWRCSLHTKMYLVFLVC